MTTEDALTDISSKLDGMGKQITSLKGELKSDRAVAKQRHEEILGAIQDHAEGIKQTTEKAIAAHAADPMAHFPLPR